MQDSINLRWLLRLRWCVAAGQLGTLIALYAATALPLPFSALLFIALMTVTSNLAVRLFAPPSQTLAKYVVGTLMLLDVGLLTSFLYLTGGPLNPFSFLYLVNIALGAIVLPSMWTWGLCAISLASYALLFFLPSSSAGHSTLDMTGHMNLHLRGMWLAFAVTAASIVYFVTRITKALAEREAEVQAARERQQQVERFAALATLAAGAAHELSTPLSTIALAANELSRSLNKLPQSGPAADSPELDDALLIRQETSRCQRILQRMSADAGQVIGGAAEPTPIQSIVKEAINHCLHPERVSFVPWGENATVVTLPKAALMQAVGALLQNALDAGDENGMVEVDVNVGSSSVRVSVVDHGLGMDEATLRQATDPFFTTKEPGKGMGLGLYLVRSFAEGLGGHLDLKSSVNAGTTAVIELPWTPAESRTQPPVKKPHSLATQPPVRLAGAAHS